MLRWWTSDISQIRSCNQDSTHTKDELYSEVTLWKTILALVQYFYSRVSSASHMTAAKVMDVIARVPECAGPAATAVSAYTQAEMEDASALSKRLKSECPDIGIRPPRHKWLKSWSNIAEPGVLLERILYGHPHARLLWKRQFEKKKKLRLGWERPICAPTARSMAICIRLCMSVHVDDIKLGWEEAKPQPLVEKVDKLVDLGEPTSFLVLGMHST